MALTSSQETDILRSLGLGIEKKKDPVKDAAYIAITSWSKGAIQMVQKILLNKGTGSLGQSVVPLPIRQEGNVYVIEVQADAYADFVDQGVNGLEQSFNSPY